MQKPDFTANFILLSIFFIPITIGIASSQIGPDDGIRLNNDGYRLIDIALKSSGNRSILEASLASSISASNSADKSSAVGHTVLIISEVDDMEVVEGYLAMDDPKYSGNYSLSLSEWSGRGPRAGPRWAMDTD